MKYLDINTIVILKEWNGHQNVWGEIVGIDNDNNYDVRFYNIKGQTVTTLRHQIKDIDFTICPSQYYLMCNDFY